MSDYSTQAYEQYKTITLGKLCLTIKATVSLDDTITVSELSDIDVVKAVVLSTGAECAISAVDNVITIDEDPLSDKEVILLVIGDAV